MGGTVSIDSEVGRGTTFVVRLPVDPVGSPTDELEPVAG
jgi:signal transduction histidine kinase